MDFVGRNRELALLQASVDQTTAARGDGPLGAAFMIRGRRRIGKSRLAEEFIRRAGLPSVYFQAALGASPLEELREWSRQLASSDLPGREFADGSQPDSLDAAFRLLDACLPSDQPSIVVLDELPWLLSGFEGGAGILQRAWDRRLSRKPVLLLLLGSDIAMMEELSAPHAPFHGRATEMRVDALTPADLARLLSVDPWDAFDAHLVTGGQPMVASEWRPGMSTVDFLSEAFSTATSALVVTGDRILDLEFAGDARSRAILNAIGGKGERSYTAIARAAGELPHDQLSKGLGILLEAGVIAADEPLSTRSASKDRRWRIDDPALRFWLAFVGPALNEIDRGRPDLAMARVHTGFASWRGRAIEPIVRSALSRLLPDGRFTNSTAIGGWWNRANNPEIDLIGGKDRPSTNIEFAGTIKWRRDAPVTGAEITELARKALAVPGATPLTSLVAVCPGGSDEDPRLARCWTAADLLEAW